MQFACAQLAAGKRTTKFALVAALHVILGFAVMNTMHVKLIALPALAPPVALVPALPPPVVPPPATALPTPPMQAPPIFVPATEVALPMPALPATVSTTTASTVVPQGPAPGTASGDPATPHVASAPVRTAAMADGCARPAYPPQAARNGDTGTVTLALLVGVDGRVQASRIAHSSGFHDLDRAALTGLALCTFQPATQDGVPEAGWTQIAYQWTLE